MLEKLKDLNKNFIIIIISGYDDFSYAQKALKLNVFDYILKPVSKENMESIITKAVLKLRINDEENKYGQWVKKQLHENMDQLKRNFFVEWFQNKIDDDEMIKQMKYFNIKFGNSVGIIIIQIIDKLNINIMNNKWNTELIEYAIGNMLKEIFKESESIIVFSDDNKNIILLINKIDIKYWIKTKNEIESKIKTYLKCDVIIEQDNTEDGILKAKDLHFKLKNKIKNKNEFSSLVLSAVNYIQGNYYYNDLNINDISDKLEVTSSYLSKILKKETGLSFIDYLTNTRIEKAMNIMKDPSIKIYDVAELVGYSNQHYFCRAFKKITGISPTEYKKGK